MFSTSGYGGLGDLASIEASLIKVNLLPKEMAGGAAKCQADGRIPQYDILRKSYDCVTREAKAEANQVCRAGDPDSNELWNSGRKKFDCFNSKTKATFPIEVSADVGGIGAWWSKQVTGAKIGIVVGGVSLLGIVGYLIYDMASAPKAKAKANRRRKRIRSGSSGELRTMREMLSQHGVQTKYAQSMLNRGIGPDELRPRLLHAHDGRPYVSGFATPNRRRRAKRGAR